MRTIQSTSPKDYQVFFMVGQSLMQSSTFVGESANINGREFDDQSLSYIQVAETYGLRTMKDTIAATDSVGFDTAFARELYDGGERNIVILRYAVGGHSIIAFVPEEDRLVTLPGGMQDLWPQVIPWMNERLSRLTMFGDTYTLRAMVMWQGSSDRGDSGRYNAYGAHLDILKARWRESFSALKWLQVISPNWDATTGTLTVQQAQRDSSDNDPLASYVESDPALSSAITFLDGTHPDSDSTEKVGVQVARAFEALGW